MHVHVCIRLITRLSPELDTEYSNAIAVNSGAYTRMTALLLGNCDQLGGSCDAGGDNDEQIWYSGTVWYLARGNFCFPWLIKIQNDEGSDYTEY